MKGRKVKGRKAEIQRGEKDRSFERKNVPA